MTNSLFVEFPSLEALAGADIAALERAVHSTGFYRAKARNLRETARLLLANHGGELPSDIDALTALPGVGRKTANVVRGHIFGIPSVTVDTHVGRLARRLGLTRHTDAVKIEFDLMRILPKDVWICINQQLISHGRAVCKSQNPRCGECELRADCEAFCK